MTIDNIPDESGTRYIVQYQDQLMMQDIDLPDFKYEETVDGGKTWFHITQGLLLHELKQHYPLSYLKALEEIEEGKTHWINEWNDGQVHGYRKVNYNE